MLIKFFPIPNNSLPTTLLLILCPILFTVSDDPNSLPTPDPIVFNIPGTYLAPNDNKLANIIIYYHFKTLCIFIIALGANSPQVTIVSGSPSCTTDSDIVAVSPMSQVWHCAFS